MQQPLPQEVGKPRFNHFIVCGQLFEVDAKYKPIKPIGKGAYGVVCSASNSVTGERLAIKKISNAFDNVVDAKRMLREIKLLRHLQHENIVKIKDILPPPSLENFKDMYILYELMDTDLHQIIRSSQPLSDEHGQFFIYQLLRGLKYIHSANVLHRDLKPSNILLNANCDLRICDFGLARTSSEKEYMTEYVVTRWYRAPELLLSCAEYTAAIDIWSCGCIFAELLGRKPLFPGRGESWGARERENWNVFRSTGDVALTYSLRFPQTGDGRLRPPAQFDHKVRAPPPLPTSALSFCLVTVIADRLAFSHRVLGTPSDEDLAFVDSEKAKGYLKAMPPCQRIVLGKYFPHANPLALDLIDRMLQFNPHKRISVEQALEHPYFSGLHDPNDEPMCPGQFYFPLEEGHLTGEQIKYLVFEDIKQNHPEHFQS